MSQKKEILLDLLTREWVYLHVDGRTDGVDLPEDLKRPGVSLQIGYGMPLPIPDLVVDDFGVTATLSFQRTPHRCRIPWAAIFALVDGTGRGLVFPEDVPAELRDEMRGAAEGAKKAEVEAPAAAPAPSADEPADATPRFKSGRPRPSHLKLV